MPRESKRRVTRITFTVYLEGGKKNVCEFIRKEKVDDLLEDPGSLGEFLRDLAKLERSR